MKLGFLCLTFLFLSSCAQNSSYGPDYWDNLQYVVDDDSIYQKDFSNREPASISLGDTQATQTPDGYFEYQLYEGETLMLVAWKFYGDYKRWREIEAMNPGSNFKHGDKIRIPKYDKAFEYNPGGTPYLIQKGDTLGRVSTKRYDTKKYWKKIWKHNDRLIKDPDLIFAGFTIFTPDLKTTFQ